MRLLREALAILLIAIGSFNTAAAQVPQLPPGFVYLRLRAPSILQDIRYAGAHNFVGRPIEGYGAAECVLTAPAAQALSAAQTALAKMSLSFIVWDCYRPTQAVADFLAWSKDARETRMKIEFYPKTDKTRLFSLGYLATHSAHSRGSTADLALVPLGLKSPPPYDARVALQPCTAPRPQRFDDGTLDFGTGYDCLDPAAGISARSVGAAAVENRRLLSAVMQRQGFRPYVKEWWHFELIDEPFPTRSFDFPIVEPKDR